MNPSVISSHIPFVEGEIQRLDLVTDERHDAILMPPYPADLEMGEVSPDAMEEYLRLIARVRKMAPSEKVARILQASVGAQVLAGMNEEQLGYHVPYWTQALIKNPNTILRVDDVWQVLYPVSPKETIPLTKIEGIDRMLSGFSDTALWAIFVKNFPEIQTLFMEKKDEAEAVLSRGNLQILSNHASWLNLPLIAHCLHRFWGIPKEDIYILLGPALTTQALGYGGAVHHAHIIKTVPDTKNAETGFSGIARIRAHAWKQILRIFKDTQGKILLISPSGTTDKYNPETGIFELVYPSEGSIGMTEKLHHKGMPSMIIGSNDRAIFPGNSRLKPRQRAEIRLSGVSNDAKHWMDLPKYVVDRHGIPIAQWEEKN